MGPARRWPPPSGFAAGLWLLAHLSGRSQPPHTLLPPLPAVHHAAIDEGSPAAKTSLA